MTGHTCDNTAAVQAASVLCTFKPRVRSRHARERARAPQSTVDARQLCAGLEAAHAEGVLHRDLKPANVMPDGRGRAKITDFGLAGATEGIAGHEARAGTPQYMAPEQLAGGALTKQTDLYALGLVFYELFTGKRAFEGRRRRTTRRCSSWTKRRCRWACVR